MIGGEPSSSGSSPKQPSLELLEQQLRALPPPPMPDALPARLIAAIPPLKAATSAATGVAKGWLLASGAAVAGVVATVVLLAWLIHANPVAPNGAGKNGNVPAAPQTTSPAFQTAPAAASVIRQYEHAVSVDPYNAEAWFDLAKAQADAHRLDDAISAAEEALDVARSRNNAGLAKAIEAWLQTHREMGARLTPH